MAARRVNRFFSAFSEMFKGSGRAKSGITRRHGLELKISKKDFYRGGRFLAYSPEMKKFVSKNRGILLTAKELIEKNFDELLFGRQKTRKGITVKRAATGRDRGGSLALTLKVSARGKELFVKITDFENGLDTLRGFQTAEKYLKTIKHRAGKFSVRVIKPHLIYSRETMLKDSLKYTTDRPNGDKSKAKPRVYIVTDFYREGEVIQLSNLKKLKRKVRSAEEMERLFSATARIRIDLMKEGIQDFPGQNIYYHPKSKTILLFDLSR
ncbi:MAG: hypothetical protein NTZ73_02805 [Candidatus Diapherotrites archaeon]|nr:hypothetical protein [Candidatus Diapherotrites archaeon]